MKRNPLSHRTQKWIERNDISYPYVEEKIKKLCDNIYHITNYKIDFVDFERERKALWVYKDKIDEKYIFIIFNHQEICLELYEGRKLLNKYNRDDCWVLALQKSEEWSRVN